MLPVKVSEFLQQAAKDAHTALPQEEESLFQAGILDSFSLVDFVSVIEQECGVTIDDSELRPSNFDTLRKVEAFIQKRGRK